MSALSTERVLTVHHWTDRLFSFTTTRGPGLRFTSGQFVMLGLQDGSKPLLRAYSVASAAYDEHLEFFSIKVPDGPLTSRLQNIKIGDEVYVGRKATGTLLADNLLPGKNLYLLATGTGLAPFLSVTRDPDVYERFEKVILVHGVRHVADLAYRDMIEKEMPDHPLVGDQARSQLIYYPTVTREPFIHQGRITDLLDSGKLNADLGQPPLNTDTDRVMLCGSEDMLRDLVALMEKRGMTEGSSHTPGHYVIEKAFAEK